MINEIVVQKTALPAMAMSESELMSVLSNSLYPGAKDESIKLVIGYCKAAGLDPIKKPVHIVPMDVAVKDSNGKVYYEKRDVIMPGIGSYRADAARSGECAGVSEPEFGPVKTISVQRKQYNNKSKDDKSFTMVADGEMEFPEWCKVTVKRLVGNTVAEFTAKELWLENYATAGKDSTAPNAMWKKRPYAQLAKCAEAQALRKGFPECGSQPTADEMEGKPLDDGATAIDAGTGEIIDKDPEFLPQEVFAKHSGTWKESISSGKKKAESVINWVNSQGNGKLTDAMVKELNDCIHVAKEDAKPKADTKTEPEAKVTAAIDENDIPWEN